MAGKVLAGAVLALLLLSPLATGADDAAAKLIKRGDKFYTNRGRGVKWVAKAIQCYEKALAVDTKSVEASWKLAMASYWLGCETEGEAEKLKIFQKGIDAAKRAVKIDDESVECHYWLGVCYGKHGETKGVMNSISLIEPIKKEMARVIELDETYACGGAYVVLGRMYYKLPGALGGSNEKSVEYLKKALKIDKGHLLTYLFLADTYLEMDKEEEAIKALKFIIEAPVQKNREPENESEKAKAKKLLEELTKPEKKE
jgi:tetratricopeptide (TPR) repeat protein